MKISPADIPAIYAGYVDSELAPKAVSSLQRFMAYGSVFVAQRKYPYRRRRYCPQRRRPRPSCRWKSRILEK